MRYERQSVSALRMVRRYGAAGSRERTVNVPDVAQPWKSTTSVESVPLWLVSFPDDGVVFLNHNIQGNLSVLTLVSTAPLDIQVGDVIKAATKSFTVEAAKPLDPDLTGAILWAALVR